RVNDDGETRELALALGESLPDGDALGADGLLVGRALDVASRVEFAALGLKGRSDAKVRVARKGAVARVRRAFDEFLQVACGRVLLFVRAHLPSLLDSESDADGGLGLRAVRGGDALAYAP